MASKSVRKIQSLTGKIARPYAKRLMGYGDDGVKKGSWFRSVKGSNIRKMVAKRVRAEREAGYIKRGRKDY